MHEAQLHDLSVFLTLTYSDANLPPGGSLRKRDFQLFIKRLRKIHDGKIRYFHVGEYGDATRRPHYHAIIFGCDFADKTFWKKAPSGEKLYISETLQRLWPLGDAYIGQVSIQSAAYVARYCMKKITGEKANEHYKAVDLSTGEIHEIEPEYATMSLKPGIGQGWYDRYASDVFPSDYAVHKGKRLAVPKFYYRKLQVSDPKEAERIKWARVRRASKRKADSTPERLAIREEVKLSQLKSLKRELE